MDTQYGSIAYYQCADNSMDAPEVVDGEAYELCSQRRKNGNDGYLLQLFQSFEDGYLSACDSCHCYY